MQATTPFGNRLDLIAAAPNVGGLMALCEENYAALLRLAPVLPQLGGSLISRRCGHADLLIRIVEQAPYTTTLRLTHRFGESETAGGCPPEPDALLRAYHDAGQVEVLDLRQTVLPVLSHYQAPALAAKWRANLFLSKWLGYCIQQGHRFAVQADACSTERARELTPSA
jgi:uncharacterized protein YqiB (DUF1249 family)